MAPAVGVAAFAGSQVELRLFVSKYLELIDDSRGIEGVE